jgi:8-oxo-dGTP pyrophosphatase MutT (NUDIX family)
MQNKREQFHGCEDGVEQRSPECVETFSTESNRHEFFFLFKKGENAAETVHLDEEHKEIKWLPFSHTLFLSLLSHFSFFDTLQMYNISEKMAKKIGRSNSIL